MSANKSDRQELVEILGKLVRRIEHGPADRVLHNIDRQVRRLGELAVKLGLPCAPIIVEKHDNGTVWVVLHDPEHDVDHPAWTAVAQRYGDDPTWRPEPFSDSRRRAWAARLRHWQAEFKSEHAPAARRPTAQDRAIAERRSAARELHIQGQTQDQIARRLHVSEATISRDLNAGD